MLEARNRGYQFVKIPFPRYPPVADFELLVAEASALPDMVTVDDQRLFDAGLAAEYFLQLKQSFALPLVDCAPTSAPAPSFVSPVTLGSDLSCGLHTLPSS